MYSKRDGRFTRDRREEKREATRLSRPGRWSAALAPSPADSNVRSFSESFFNFINTIHLSIKFIIEYENNNSLPFLDVMVTRTSNGFSTSVYRKPTYTNLLQNFLTFISDEHCPFEPNA